MALLDYMSGVIFSTRRSVLFCDVEKKRIILIEIIELERKSARESD